MKKFEQIGSVEGNWRRAYKGSDLSEKNVAAVRARVSEILKTSFGKCSQQVMKLHLKAYIIHLIQGLESNNCGVRRIFVS